jgi:hypothetical protein
MVLTSYRCKWCGDGASSSETGIRVCCMMRDPTRQLQWSTILQPSVGSAWTMYPTAPTWCQATSTFPLLSRGHSKGTVWPPMKIMKQPYRPRTLTFTNMGSSSSWSGGTNAPVSVGTMLKNTRLIHTNMGGMGYLVHAISCRWQTSETYFLTIPRNKLKYLEA